MPGWRVFIARWNVRTELETLTECDVGACLLENRSRVESLRCHGSSPASRSLPLGDLCEFPFYGDPKFIVCVRRVRVELPLKHGLAVLVAMYTIATITRAYPESR